MYHKKWTPYFNSNQNKYKSLAFCQGRNLVVLEHKIYDGISIVTVKKPDFFPGAINLLLVYRPPNTSVVTFLDNIRTFITENTIHIVLGDFNINALDDQCLRNIHCVVNIEKIIAHNKY